MKFSPWKALRLAAALQVFSPGHAAEPAASPKPNFIVVLADDLGWSDLGCYGSTFHETPELDRLAREAMRFLNRGGDMSIAETLERPLAGGVQLTQRRQETIPLRIGQFDRVFPDTNHEVPAPDRGTGSIHRRDRRVL